MLTNPQTKPIYHARDFLYLAMKTENKEESLFKERHGDIVVSQVKGKKCLYEADCSTIS
jgi:hypothetical protein